MAKSPDAFRTIREVAEWLDTPAHVLRFWESRFAQVKPVKRAGGRRYYRPSDMELLGGIKQLLHEDGLTIRGVQKLLREQGVRYVAAKSQPLTLRPVGSEAVHPGDAEDAEFPFAFDPEDGESETMAGAFPTDALRDGSHISGPVAGSPSTEIEMETEDDRSQPIPFPGARSECKSDLPDRDADADATGAPIPFPAKTHWAGSNSASHTDTPSSPTWDDTRSDAETVPFHETGNGTGQPTRTAPVLASLWVRRRSATIARRETALTRAKALLERMSRAD